MGMPFSVSKHHRVADLVGTQLQYCSQTGPVPPWLRLVCGNLLSSDFGLTPSTYNSKTVALDNIAETMKSSRVGVGVRRNCVS